MNRPSRHLRPRKLIGFVVLVLAASLTVVGIGFAAAPVKGSKYSGRVKVSATLTVSFKVASSGKKVTSLKVSPSLPNSCGYGGPHPTASSKPAKIDRGKFTAKVTEKGAGGKVIDTATVTGSFLPGGKEKGTIKTDVPGAKSCNGRFAYSTTTKGH
jgi:hypothetical protein